MDRVFSVGDIDENFWSTIHNPTTTTADPPSPTTSSATSSTKLINGVGMNRSSSEWAFQQFLQEASVSVPDQTSSGVVATSASTTTSLKDSVVLLPTDPVEYQALLKSRLELACAAVALTRGSNVKTQESAVIAPDNISQASSTSKPASSVTFKASGADLSKQQDKDVGGPVGVPPLPAASKKVATQVKSATSGSSGEQSDDDDAEGDSEMQNGGPTDTKRMRRMLSNRESARRSRRRKQAHLSELEGQVSQLNVENSSLVKRLTDISQKYNEAAVDNRVLKADVETLRAKVKMAEETVKRVTGLNPLFQAMSEISTMNMASFAGSPNTSADLTVPVQNDLNQQHFYHSPSNIHAPAQNHRVQAGPTGLPPVENVHTNDAAAGTNKLGRTVSSMQRVDSLEHLQKRIRGNASSGGTDGAGER